MWDSLPSTVGKWTAYIPPMHRPSIGLHLLWREAPGTAMYDPKDGVRLVKSFEVAKFTMVECPEGDYFPEGPALVGDIPLFEGNDVLDFMQAVVNEAAKFGIYATGTKDATKEITALRFHLEDMRKLVFHGAGIQTPQEPRR